MLSHSSPSISYKNTLLEDAIPIVHAHFVPLSTSSEARACEVETKMVYSF